MARSLILLLTTVVALIPAVPSRAETVVPIVFPVAGTNHYTDTFGAPRGGGRTHEGTDIMAAKMTPVVAAASGTVGWVSSTCCAFEVIHEDGYRSRYIHLNNDTPGTDDGLGWGIAPGIESGATVEAGQLIGWVGDSGNAEATAPHLHFELRDADGIAFNSYPSLQVAVPPDDSATEWIAAVASQGSLALVEPTISIPVHATNAVPLVGDFDGDETSEAAVLGQSLLGLAVSELDGSSSTWAPGFGSPPLVTLVGDFDGDGDDDIGAMATNGNWTGYRSTGNSFEVESWGRHSGTPWEEFMVGDFDGDDADEIVAFHPPTKKWWLSQLTASGWKHVAFSVYGTANGWQTHLSADIDSDGKDEVISFHPSNGNWWASGLGESPRRLVDLATNTGWLHLSTVDLDSDGVDEIVQYHPSNGSWWITDPSTSPARVSRWTTFNTRTGWEFASTMPDNATLAIRHRNTGNVWTVAGTDGRLDLMGQISPGPLDGFWIATVDGNPALIALRRD